GLSLDILLDALARESWRIERAAGRHRLRADEGLVVVDEIEAAAIDHQQSSQFRIGGLAMESVSLRVALLPKDQFQMLAGFHQLVDHAPLEYRITFGME